MTGQRSLRNVFTPTGYSRQGIVKIRRPLTTGQHILHLLLTVFTAGLWLPVWIVRAFQGNVTWDESTEGIYRVIRS